MLPGYQSKQTADGAQSVHRTLAVLRTLAAGQEAGLRLTDIANQARLNKATAHRFLRVLCDEGFAEKRSDTRRYVIGKAIAELSLARVLMFPIRSAANPAVSELAKYSGDSVFLTIRSGTESICLDRVSGPYPIQVRSVEVGVRRPLGVGVGGLVLLAALSNAEVRAITHANEPMLAHHRITFENLVLRAQQARRRGFAYASPGVVPGTRAVAVPILSDQGRALAAISIATIAARLPESRLESLLGQMRQCAQAVAKRASAMKLIE